MYAVGRMVGPGAGGGGTIAPLTCLVATAGCLAVTGCLDAPEADDDTTPADDDT